MRRAAVVVVLLPFLSISPSGAQTALRDHTDDVTYVAFLPDGKTLLTGAEDETVRLWDVAAGQASTIWQKVPEFDPAPSTSILSLSADGSKLARAGAAQGSADVWDVARVQPIRSLQAHAWTVLGVALSGDGAVLTTFTAEELKIWDVATGRSRGALAAPAQYSFCAAAISADSARFAAASSDKRVVVYDLAAGKLTHEFDAGPGRPQALAFSPDGKLLAGASDGDSDGNVHLWDLAQDAALPGVVGPPQTAKAVAFSPDGRFLASAGRAVRVWEIAAHKLVQEFPGHEGPVRSLAFSPDGHLLASAGEDNVVWLWKLGETH